MLVGGKISIFTSVNYPLTPKKTIMKRLLLFLLSIFISLSISAQEKDDEKTIRMDLEELICDYDRSIIPRLTATYHTEVSEIHMTFYNFGEADIYIIDRRDNIILMQSISETENFTTLPVPIDAGLYYIIVISNLYYAEGEFIVE